MNPSTSRTAIGSLKPASPSRVRSSRRRSPEPRSREKTAAPSVEATIEPSSNPSTSVKSNSHQAAALEQDQGERDDADGLRLLEVVEVDEPEAVGADEHADPEEQDEAGQPQA